MVTGSTPDGVDAGPVHSTSLRALGYHGDRALGGKRSRIKLLRAASGFLSQTQEATGVSRVARQASASHLVTGWGLCALGLAAHLGFREG